MHECFVHNGMLEIERGVFAPSDIPRNTIIIPEDVLFQCSGVEDTTNENSIACCSQTNRFNLTNSTKWMSKTICQVNHSCNPNVQWGLDPDSKRGILISTKDIPAETELFANYLGPAAYQMTTAQRQEATMNTFNFQCSCSECQSSNDKPREQFAKLHLELMYYTSSNDWKKCMETLTQMKSLITQEFDDHPVLKERMDYYEIQIHIERQHFIEAYDLLRRSVATIELLYPSTYRHKTDNAFLKKIPENFQELFRHLLKTR